MFYKVVVSPAQEIVAIIMHITDGLSHAPRRSSKENGVSNIPSSASVSLKESISIIEVVKYDHWL